MEYENEIIALKKTILQLKERWPAHSVKPQMVQELEHLEERLEQLREKAITKINQKEMANNE